MKYKSTFLMPLFAVLCAAMLAGCAAERNEESAPETSSVPETTVPAPETEEPTAAATTEPTEEPAAETKDETAEAPAETLIPSEESAEPIIEEPIETAPAETTPAPAETTPAPAETTPAPAETTPAPAETTTAQPQEQKTPEESSQENKNASKARNIYGYLIELPDPDTYTTEGIPLTSEGDLTAPAKPTAKYKYPENAQLEFTGDPEIAILTELPGGCYWTPSKEYPNAYTDPAGNLWINDKPPETTGAWGRCNGYYDLYLIYHPSQDEIDHAAALNALIEENHKNGPTYSNDGMTEQGFDDVFSAFGF